MCTVLIFLQEVGSAAIMTREEDLCRSVYQHVKILPTLSENFCYTCISRHSDTELKSHVSVITHCRVHTVMKKPGKSWNCRI